MTAHIPHPTPVLVPSLNAVFYHCCVWMMGLVTWQKECGVQQLLIARKFHNVPQDAHQVYREVKWRCFLQFTIEPAGLPCCQLNVMDPNILSSLTFSPQKLSNRGIEQSDSCLRYAKCPTAWGLFGFESVLLSQGTRRHFFFLAHNARIWLPGRFQRGCGSECIVFPTFNFGFLSHVAVTVSIHIHVQLV